MGFLGFKNDHLKIGKSIMDEVVNHIGVFDAPMYNEKWDLVPD